MEKNNNTEIAKNINLESHPTPASPHQAVAVVLEACQSSVPSHTEPNSQHTAAWWMPFIIPDTGNRSDINLWQPFLSCFPTSY